MSIATKWARIASAEDAPFSKEQLEEMNDLYSAALREVRSKIDNLCLDIHIGGRESIQYISQRIKSLESILGKLRRRGLPEEYETVILEIRDIAGIRVVCDYISDIYDIAQRLLDQDDICLIQKKDYIAHPKPNGYRSLHMIVETPVTRGGEKSMIPVELQFRTIAMDCWASLEHQLRYKASGNMSASLSRDLTAVAENLHNADLEMQRIHNEVVRMDNPRPYYDWVSASRSS